MHAISQHSGKFTYYCVMSVHTWCHTLLNIHVSVWDSSVMASVSALAVAYSLSRLGKSDWSYNLSRRPPSGMYTRAKTYSLQLRSGIHCIWRNSTPIRILPALERSPRYYYARFPIYIYTWVTCCVVHIWCLMYAHAVGKRHVRFWMNIHCEFSTLTHIFLHTLNRYVHVWER